MKLEGLPVRGVEPVKRWSGKTGRVDLHLATRYREHDRVRHLVVELKAPDLMIKRAELDQVEDYANTVLANPAFASEQSQWDFVLVGTDLHDLVENRLWLTRRPRRRSSTVTSGRAVRATMLGVDLGDLCGQLVVLGGLYGPCGAASHS